MSFTIDYLVRSFQKLQYCHGDSLGICWKRGNLSLTSPVHTMVLALMTFLFQCIIAVWFSWHCLKGAWMKIIFFILSNEMTYNTIHHKADHFGGVRECWDNQSAYSRQTEILIYLNASPMITPETMDHITAALWSVPTRGRINQQIYHQNINSVISYHSHSSANSHKRHTIACLTRQAVGCLFWDQSLIFLLYLVLK